MRGGGFRREGSAGRRVGPRRAAAAARFRRGPRIRSPGSEGLDRLDGVGCRTGAGGRGGGREFRRLGGERGEDRAAPFEPRLARREVADPVFDICLIRAAAVRRRVGQGGVLSAPILAGGLHRRLGERGGFGRAVAKGEAGGAGESESERQRREREQRPEGRGPEVAVRIASPREIDTK